MTTQTPSRNARYVVIEGPIGVGKTSLGRLLSDLLNHFRNLLLYQVSGGDLGLLEVSEAEGGSLKQQSSQATNKQKR